jgi:hypothetical protein
MTIVQRFSLCLSAALYLCCGIVSAQQPTQQRFLRFLGQRSVTTGTLLPTVEPFRAGVPTTASLVFAIMDSEGRIVKDDSTVVSLSLVGQNSSDNNREEYFTLSNACLRNEGFNFCYPYTVSCLQGPVPMRASSGLIEFVGLRISGKAKENAMLICSSATIEQTTVTVSLIGGKAAWFRFERMKNGQLTVPGKSYYDFFEKASADLTGTNPFIEVGKPVILGTDTNDYRYITVRAVDWWNNTATYSTTATIDASDGQPPIDQVRTLLVGNQAKTDPMTGRAIFKDFQILGATASNITLYFRTEQFYAGQYYDTPRNSREFNIAGGNNKNAAYLTCSLGMPNAGYITLNPGVAVAIVPNLLNDVYGTSLSWYGNLNRMPSRFTIGKSNADDPRTWFYLQAVDQFGNRVDNGPNAYNGGVATIRIATPEEGLPRSTTSNFQFSASNDPYVRTNSQRFAATGTSAVAVNGLYTFNNFTPLGPASSSPTDTVVLTFEDPALQGAQVSQFTFPWLASIFRPIPPITTATTTFVQTTNVALRSETPDVSLTPNPASDALHIALALPESAPVLVRIEDVLGRTVLRHEEASAVQGTFATMLDVSRLAQGAYTLHVLCGRERWTRRVIILR